MSDFEMKFLLFLLVVFLGFTALIIFLLRLRKRINDRNLKTPSAEIWAGVSSRLTRLGLKKEDMLFATPSDLSTMVVTLLVKNFSDEIVGQIIFQKASRERTVVIGDKSFLIELPFTWRRSARLVDPLTKQTLATYAETGWLGQHEVRIEGYGHLRSVRPKLSMDSIVDYLKAEEIVGSSQEIQSFIKKGRILILPDKIPLEVRLFILSL